MNRKLYYLLLALPLCLLACGKMEEINTDPARPAETEPRYLLANAEKRAADLMYNGYYNGRIGMHYAQYWTGTDKTSESRNLITDEGLWQALYTGPLMDLQEISAYYDRNPAQRNEQMLAVANILKAWIFHVLTDVYADIPCSQALQVAQYPRPAFDRGVEVYRFLLDCLNEQTDILDHNLPGAITGDILGNGNREYWIKFANALKMRIALRMADVQPVMARDVIEAAAARTLQSVADDVFFPYNNAAAGNRFPYNDADRPLVEFALTETLIDYLQATGDPRLEIYARPSEAGKQYRGKPYGQADNLPQPDSLSRPGTRIYSPSGKGYIITYAEVAFIKAEAVERGMYAGGDAATFYEEGIRASMQQWGIADSDGRVQRFLKKVPYAAGNWRDVIGSQKWVALYPQGLQAWMERLRLDFKQPLGKPLFIDPVSGSLDPDIAGVPLRLTYPVAVRNTNGDRVTEAALRIGGDSKATPNWWNVR